MINFELLTSKCKVPSGYSISLTGHMTLTIFSEGKEGSSPQLVKRETRCLDKQIPANPHPEVTLSRRIKSWLDRAIKNITVAPRYRQIILGRLKSEKEQC